MITLPRRQARRLRAVFRRSVLGIGHRGPIPPLILRTDGDQLRAQHRYAALAVEHVEPGPCRAQEAIALPLDALADCEGRADVPVTIEAAAPDRTVVRWVDASIPQSRQYVVPVLDTLGTFPESPRSWTAVPADLLDALTEATATAADDTTRYALGCLQLRGSGGEVVATDGRQLLVSGGFPFPWSDDVLVRRSPVFASRELPRDRPMSIGKTDTHVVLRVGPWTLYLEIQTDARFPRVDQVIPDARGATTRLRIDGEDAAFLAPALDRLPGGDEPDSPATLDLNGEVVVRARGSDPAQVTELVLSRSRSTGTPVRLNGNRGFLARALRLGFRDVAIADAEAPVVFREGRRTFAFQPLNKESAIAPTDDVTRIESSSQPPRPIPRSDAPHPGESPVNRKSIPVQPTSLDDGKTNSPTAPESPGPGGLVTLIKEAESLYEALSDDRMRARRLTAALRRYRKQARLMSSTIAALKQLRFQEVTP